MEILGVVITISFLVYLLLCLKYKEGLVVFPYFFGICITPLYVFLDMKVFVKILGCGCVPGAQTNMLNIPFNANDFRYLVYIVICIFMTVIGIKISKKFSIKILRSVYILGIIVINVIVTYNVCKMFMWA